jgi:pantothenate kinase-related protein Tda10
MEMAIATRHLQDTQNALLEQTKAAAALEAEVETFRLTMNARLEYYRQLQTVSDSVLPHEGPKTDDAVARMIKTEEELANKLASAEAKHRYCKFLCALHVRHCAHILQCSTSKRQDLNLTSLACVSSAKLPLRLES